MLTNQINLGVEITASKYIVRALRFGEQLSSLIINGTVHSAIVTQSIKDFKLLNEAETYDRCSSTAFRNWRNHKRNEKSNHKSMEV